MKKNGCDKRPERVGGTEGIIPGNAKPSNKPPKPESTEPVRKRIIPLLGKGSIQIFDMRAVLK